MSIGSLTSWRPSPAIAISFLALFVVFSGTAIALQGVNSVKSDDIAPGAVKRSDVVGNAIRGAEVRNDTLTAKDIDEATIAGRAPAGPAGGDLTGSYPNPRNASTVIDSAELMSGAVGASDLGPITTVQSTSAPFAFGAGSAFIQCPAGTLLIGGGGAPSRERVYMTLSRKSDPNGWRYDAASDGGGPATVTVFAYCLG